MLTKESCGNCKHCGFSEKASEGWCRLRDIKVHKEVMQFVFCHHWTKKEPSLPNFKETISKSPTDLQLEFNRALVGNDR